MIDEGDQHSNYPIDVRGPYCFEQTSFSNRFSGGGWIAVDGLNRWVFWPPGASG